MAHHLSDDSMPASLHHATVDQCRGDATRDDGCRPDITTLPQPTPAVEPVYSSALYRAAKHLRECEGIPCLCADESNIVRPAIRTGESWADGVTRIIREHEEPALDDEPIPYRVAVPTVPQWTPSWAAAHGELESVTAALGTGELMTLVVLARRLRVGQERYGQIDLKADPRDWRKEQREELLDFAIYSAFEALAQ